MKFVLGSFEIVFIFVKTLGYWLYHSLLSLWPWVRHRKNWKTIRQYITMAHRLSKFAKKEKLAKNIGWLAQKFDDITKQYSDEDTKRAASEISGAGGILEDLKIAYEGGVVTGNAGPLEAVYDPKNGQVKFGLKL